MLIRHTMHVFSALEMSQFIQTYIFLDAFPYACAVHVAVVCE